MKSVLFAAMLVLSSPVFAADFSAKMTDLEGKPIEDGSPEKGAFTLGQAAIRALTSPYPDEQNLAAEEKFKRAELAERIYKNPNLTLTAEETALVKKLIGKAYAPIIVLRAWPMLDPALSK